MFLLKLRFLFKKMFETTSSRQVEQIKNNIFLLLNVFGCEYDSPYVLLNLYYPHFLEESFSRESFEESG